jgi:hypothetical protein
MIVEAINWLLINGANVLLWIWGLIKTLIGGTFAAVDAVLNPILSPVLAVINPICVWLGDCVYAVLAPLPPWLSLTLLSGFAGVAMLIAFRYTSNQAGIGEAKDQIKANLLAMKLYNDELWVTFQVQWRLLRAVLRLQRYMITPVVVMLAPMVLGFAQMGIRHQWRALNPGEQALIKMKLRESEVNLTDAEMEPNPGVVVEVGPVPGNGELVWRVRGGEPGRHIVRLVLNGNPTGSARLVTKELVVGYGFQRVSAMRVGADWVEQLLHPVEPRLSDAGPVCAIEIGYPGVSSWIYGSNWWIVYFFAVSMLTAILLKPVFKVRF